VQRVHGGATPTDRQRALEDSYAQRRESNSTGKQSMGHAAITLLRAGDTVIFDVGTSVLHVARLVPLTWTGRVLTNSLPVVAEMADRPGVEVLVCGGRARPGDLALSGSHATAFFSDYYADLAFLGSGGIHSVAGLTDFHSDEVDVRRVMIDHSSASYVLADATKLGVIAARHVCTLNRLSGVISDGVPDQDLAEALNAAEVRLISPIDTTRAPITQVKELLHVDRPSAI